MKLSFFGVFGFGVLISSCEVINPKESVPGYLHIDSFTLNTDYNTQGSASTQGISDVWVFVNDNLVGGFELPATVPVLSTGDINVKLRAGIKNSGAANLRREYPFFNLAEENISLSAQEVVSLKPQISYYSSLNFAFIEDFEGSNYGISTTSGSIPLWVSNQSAECIEGQGSLKIEVHDQETFRAQSNDVFVLPKQGKEVYLEMDYQSTGYIEVRLIANQSSGVPTETSVIILYPSGEQKKKVYLDLGPIVSTEVSAASFTLAFLAYNATNQTHSVNYIDNIKLIHPTL